MAAEAGIFVPSGTQSGKAGEKLKNNGISHETLRWSPSVIAHAPAAWRGYHIAEFKRHFRKRTP